MGISNAFAAGLNFLKEIWPAVWEAIKLIFAEKTGEDKQKQVDTIQQDETDLEAYRQRERDRQEIAGMSDDAVERELRNGPH